MSLCTNYALSVVKVSRNAPERRSGAPKNLKKVFRGTKMSEFSPERLIQVRSGAPMH